MKNSKDGVRPLVGMLVVLSQVALGAQQAPPLPEREAFIAQVRAHLRTDEDLQSQYTYLERRQAIRISKLGKVHLGDVRLFQVYPAREPGQTYKRLIAVNDAPLDPQLLRQRDEARQKVLTDRASLRPHETPAERARRERAEAAARQRQQDVVDDVFRVYDIALVGRDTLDGRRMIVATLTPRARVPTRSQIGKYFPKFRGRAWVSEDDYQVAKAELEATDDILMGWGILGRVHQGSRLTIDRRKINEEVWLPARMSFEVAGRALFRKFRVQAVTEFSDYQKFVVTDSETYSTPD